MLIKGNFIDVFNRQIFPARVFVRNGFIEKIERIEGSLDSYILPGFIDSHVHIESSMMVPSEFARAAVVHGTVAVVSDPHEIANVLGLKGIDFMIDNAAKVPMKFFFGAPSCVPATDFESSGARIGSKEIEALLDRDDIYYLSELMNYPGVLASDKEVIKKIDSAKKRGKLIDGHAPGLCGDDLLRYAGAGISTDHEAFTLEEASEKINAGMQILIREGSAARNMDALAPLFDISPDKLMLCSDDIHPEMLLKRHINKLVAELIKRGYNIFDVIRAASLNAVKHYGLSVGMLREGDRADFIVVDSIKDFNVLETWIDGRKVYSEAKIHFDSVLSEKPNTFNSSEISGTDIYIKNQPGLIRVIDVKDGELYTKSFKERWSEEDCVKSYPERDILKIVVKDRYKDRPVSVAFIRGFGLKEGAIAGSVAHDSHNIIAVGADDDSIVRAVNAIIHERGGLSVSGGEGTEILPLPIAGIMSDVPCGTIAEKYLKLSERVKNMGSHLKAPFMTLSFMSLLVIPELKLGDAGLFDGINFRFTELFDKNVKD